MQVIIVILAYTYILLTAMQLITAVISYEVLV